MSAIIIGSDPKITIGGYDVTSYVESPISITQRLDEVLNVKLYQSYRLYYSQIK